MRYQLQHALATAVALHAIHHLGNEPPGLLVSGEWGGWAKQGSKDRTLQLALANYMRQTGLTDNFYWCLNPNSGDTGEAPLTFSWGTCHGECWASRPHKATFDT